MQKIYYDSVNNKNVVDVSGTKDEALIVSEFGLDPTFQVIEIDETTEATELVSGTLTKFDYVARGQATADANKVISDGKQTASLAKLNAGRTGADMTIEDLEDLGI